jgi:T-complex protein 1 subunit theta
MPRLGKPTEEELGYAELVEERELAEQKFLVIQGRARDASTSGGTSEDDVMSTQKVPLATIVLRGPTDKFLNEIERVISQASATFKVLCMDPRVVAGAGSTEMELACRLRAYAESLTGAGLDKYAVESFAGALEFVVRTMAENGGMPGADTIASLKVAHLKEKKASAGLDLWNRTIMDAAAGDGVWDALATKKNAFRLAVDAALDLLRINAIIAARPAGGPKPPGK